MIFTPRPLAHILVLLSIWLSCFSSFWSTATPVDEAAAEEFFHSHADHVGGHTNNWAVLVCASRFWFNYRHMANALGMYRTVKRLGIPDSNIILMLADDAACNSRNAFPGTVYSNNGRQLDLYGENIEVDYRGYEVTVENFIRLLTGRVSPETPHSKRLDTDDRSNVFIYMTGHGGNEFLKFQDYEEISAFDLADAFEQMWQKKRYNELFFMIDTCQANTMYSKIYSPNVLATGSSKLDQNSYSHSADNDLGVAVIDRYTHFVLEYLEHIDKTSNATMQDLFDSYDPAAIHSDPGVRTDLFNRSLDTVRITDFFGGVAQVEFSEHNVPPFPSSAPLSSPLRRDVNTSSHPQEEEEQEEDRGAGSGSRGALARMGTGRRERRGAEEASPLRAWKAVPLLVVLLAWAGRGKRASAWRRRASSQASNGLAK